MVGIGVIFLKLKGKVTNGGFKLMENGGDPTNLTSIGREYECATCGKKFIVTCGRLEWAYQRIYNKAPIRRYTCSWSCHRARENDAELIKNPKKSPIYA